MTEEKTKTNPWDDAIITILFRELQFLEWMMAYCTDYLYYTEEQLKSYQDRAEKLDSQIAGRVKELNLGDEYKFFNIPTS